MDPIIERILDNLKKISLKYQGMDKAYKVRDYILKCQHKLTSQGNLALVVEFKEAVHNQLEHAKKQKRQSDDQRRNYLRGGYAVPAVNRKGQGDGRTVPSHKQTTINWH